MGIEPGAVAEAAIAQLKAIDGRVFAVTGPVTAKVAKLAKTSIKGRMRGRPRWSHRGKWNGRPAVNIDGPKRKTRVGAGGTPGLFSGDLSRAVVASKKSRQKLNGTASAVTFVSAKRQPAVNAYKGQIERDYPFFKPGVDRVAPKVPALYEAAWAKATNV